MLTSDFQEIASFALEVEAIHFKSMLEANGIAAFVGSANVNTTLSHVGTALGGVKLFVRLPDVERATEIIRPLSHNLGIQSEKWLCGNCDEEISGGFQVCWSCSQARVDVEVTTRSATRITTPDVDAYDEPKTLCGEPGTPQ